MINSPGKVLIFGGYNLVMNRIKVENKYIISRALVGALYDRNGTGIVAKIREADEDRIVSKLYKIDEKPSLRSKHLVSVAMASAIKYLKMQRMYRSPTRIEIISSPMFGTPESKTGLGSSSASISTTIKAVFLSQNIDYRKHLDTIFRLSLYSYQAAGKTPVGFDFAVATYQSSVIYEKAQNIKLDLRKLHHPLKINIIPTEIDPNLDVLIYDTGHSLNTGKAVQAFRKIYRKNELLPLLREYFTLENAGVSYFMSKKYDKVGEITDRIRSIMNEIWRHMDIQEQYEPEEVQEILKDISKLDGVILKRLHGAGGESMLVVVSKRHRDSVNRYITENYPELTPLDVSLARKYLNISQ
ncbi:MAG: hypothetical protein NZ908_02030 [Candidatus Micrarchaeota archaeon]|nr:hypothetical protein [Candidatus Micrarchaeota archaeon]MCX8154325.1 hypothetical protein [Candidatus Micrarchaeota archaeon]